MNNHRQPTPSNYTFTLEPLRSDGPDSLAPDPSDGLATVRLTQIEVTWEDPLHRKMITASDDLFNPATADGTDPMPPGTTLTRAIIDFQFADSARPQTVELQPPHTINCRSPNDTDRVTNFLTKHNFVRSAHRTKAVLIAALLTAMGAVFQDALSTQLDDDHRHRQSTLHPVRLAK